MKSAGWTLGKARKFGLTKRINIFLFISLFVFFAETGMSSAQRISMPDQRRWAFTVRAGLLSNNGDLAAQMRRKTAYDTAWSINTNYALSGEAFLGFDLIRLRGTDICLNLSGLYAQPEIMASGKYGKFRAGLTQMGMARASLTFSFNSDGYKMFSMPVHVNHEAVLGITSALMYANDVKITDLANDSLGIKAINGKQFCKAIGLTFGWSWRIADSGWLIGFTGSILWYADDKSFLTIKTEESSKYTPDKLNFAPRLLEAGIGYHFQ